MTKIISDKKIKNVKGKKIVLTGGCFDILHEAHLEFLERSKKLGDTLVVLLESDENITHLKGVGRPVNNQNVRAENLSKLSFVDYIVSLRKPTSSEYYYNLVLSLKPAIIAVTKGDPLTDVKKDQAELVRGKVVEVMERNEKFSTSRLAK